MSGDLACWQVLAIIPGSALLASPCLALPVPLAPQLLADSPLLGRPTLAPSQYILSNKVPLVETGDALFQDGLRNYLTRYKNFVPQKGISRIPKCSAVQTAIYINATW